MKRLDGFCHGFQVLAYKINGLSNEWKPGLVWPDFVMVSKSWLIKLMVLNCDWKSGIKLGMTSSDAMETEGR